MKNNTSTETAAPVGVPSSSDWLAKIARMLTDAQNASVACGEWRQGDVVPYLEVLDKSLAARKALLEELERVRDLLMRGELLVSAAAVSLSSQKLADWCAECWEVVPESHPHARHG